VRSATQWSKVPQVTAAFWLVKVLSTGWGETTSDFLVRRYDPVIVVPLATAVLVAVLGMQFAARRYWPPVYWAAVAAVGVVGTMVADVAHVRFGVPYLASTVVFAGVLTAVFTAWQVSEHTLSIHSIYTPRREAFYWAAVMATFALGTAAGDMTATTLHLGFFTSGLLFAALIAIPVLGYWLFDLNAVLAFWWAYVLTRPLGASFADWMAVPPSRGGLGWGTGRVSIVLGLLIVAAVAVLTITHSDVEETVAAASSRRLPAVE